MRVYSHTNSFLLSKPASGPSAVHRPGHHLALPFSTQLSDTKEAAVKGSKLWEQPMEDAQFQRMAAIIGAPSPIGLEASMTQGVLKPMMESLQAGLVEHTFKGNAGSVWESAPAPLAGQGQQENLSVMIMGHADKIRMQVRSIGKDGKIWIDSDSFLPLTLVGNKVWLFSQQHTDAGVHMRRIPATVEALGAIHFADASVRNGDKGVKAQQLYLELGLHGDNLTDQAVALGIRQGDSVILDRPITRCVGQDAFSGAYLDNGLGCFVTAELARLVAQRVGAVPGIRCYYAFASHEEIGRFGSRVMAQYLQPDVIIAVDVNHDYVGAPNVGSKNYPVLQMGKGCTLTTGAITSATLNQMFLDAAAEHGIPVQQDVRGRDTGTDAMAGVLASIDCAATSVGFPIRNMHTTSELGHTGDVLASIEALYATLMSLSTQRVTADTLRQSHPRLDHAIDHVQDPDA